MVRTKEVIRQSKSKPFRPKFDYFRAVSFSAGSADQFETVRSVYGPTNVRPTLRPVNSIDLTHPPLGTLSILG